MRGRAGRLVGVWVLVAGMCLGLAPVPGTGAAAGDDLEALSRELTQAVLPPDVLDAPPCAMTVTTGSGTDCSMSFGTAHTGDEGAATATAIDSGDVELVARDIVRTPRWFAQLAPLPSDDGAVVRVHGFGDVAVHGPDGEVRWNRAAMSFYDGWGLSSPIVPFVLLGASPIDPFTRASERAFAAGDLTGDGIDDVAVGHYIRAPADPDGIDLEEGDVVDDHSAITVLDGRDGTTLWTQVLPGFVTQVLIVDGVLVVGNETGDRTDPPVNRGEDGTTSNLTGLVLVDGPAGLAAQQRWRIDIGSQWARWLAIEPADAGRFAVSWTDRPLGGSGDAGQVLLVDATTGAQAWEVSTAFYPRALRYDATRSRVLVHWQGDPVNTQQRLDYYVRGYNVETGVQAYGLTRNGAVLLSLLVADVQGDPDAEIVLGDLQQERVTAPDVNSRTFVASRVALYSGSNATSHWTHSVAMLEEYQAGRADGLASTAQPYGLAVGETFERGRLVLVGTMHGWGDGLRALRGTDGEMVWEHWGNDPAYPLWLLSTEIDGTPAVVGMTRSKTLRAYDLDDGATVRLVPVLADVYATVTSDVDGDGVTDLIVGGESGAVFALDGTALGDTPRVLWRTHVGHGVRHLALADLDGDGLDEVAVAASTAVASLELATGATAWRNELPGDYVFTFALGDLDGDGDTDVVVPTRTLAAYDGADGALLWEHVPIEGRELHFSVPAVTPEGQVVSQYLVSFPSPFAPRHHRGLVGLDAATGEEIWSRIEPNPTAIVRLWRSVTTAGPTADGEGTTVAITWDVRDGLPAVSPWRPRTDVLDPRTGEVQWGVGPLSTDVVPMGTVYEPAHGLFEFNWYNVTRLLPEGGRQVEFEATSDIAWVDFGDLGKGFVKAWVNVELFAENEPLRPDGHFPLSVDEWQGYFMGRMHVADLDADGADEIVAMPFDWPGRTVVAAFEGTGVTVIDYLPHGVAVLGANG